MTVEKVVEDGASQFKMMGQEGNEGRPEANERNTKRLAPGSWAIQFGDDSPSSRAHREASERREGHEEGRAAAGRAVPELVAAEVERDEPAQLPEPGDRHRREAVTVRNRIIPSEATRSQN